MSLSLKQSTAVTLVLGPFLDSTDGNTVEAALTIAQANVRLSKNAGAFAQKNNATSCTYMEAGYYSCPLSTTDTNTLGILTVAVHMAGALAVWKEYMVVPAVEYDTSVLGTDTYDVNVTAIAASAITAASIATDAIAAAKVAADAVTKIQVGLATAAALTTVDTVVDSILVDTAEIGVAGAGLTALATQASVNTIDGIVDDILVDTAVIGAAGAGLTALATQASVNVIDGIVDEILLDTAAMPTVAAIADGVWDEARAGHVAAGSFGQGVASVQGNVTGSVASVTGAVGSVTGSVTVGTNSDKAGYSISGTLTTLDALDTAQDTQHSTTQAAITTVDTVVDSILVDTDATIPAQITALNNLSAAQVNAEVVDVLTVDTFAEPTSIHSATASLKDKIGLMAMAGRNKKEQTATTQTLYADDGTTARATTGLSQDGTTATTGKWTDAV